MLEVYLTFDTEDFISTNSIPCLNRVLKSLKQYNLKGLFFITAHVAEQLRKFPLTVDLLNEHQIGYHSSSHSVHPTIFEFNDIEDYHEAYSISLERETKHIDPLTGEIGGRGGIYALSDLFPKKQIVAYRAPGMCWTPPHLEALRSLGIKYDFSTNVSPVPVNYKGITFYPYAIIGHWQGILKNYELMLFSLMRYGIAVLNIHPSLIVNQENWDSIYLSKSNPKKLAQPRARTRAEAISLFHKFELLLKQIRSLQKVNLLEVTPQLKRSYRNLTVSKKEIEKWYQRSVLWTMDKHNYQPKFLHNHFVRFFEVDS